MDKNVYVADLLQQLKNSISGANKFISRENVFIGNADGTVPCVPYINLVVDSIDYTGDYGYRSHGIKEIEANCGAVLVVEVKNQENPYIDIGDFARQFSRGFYTTKFSGIVNRWCGGLGDFQRDDDETIIKHIGSIVDFKFLFREKRANGE